MEFAIKCILFVHALTFTPFRTSWRYFLTILNLKNSQLCWKVNLSTPLDPLVTIDPQTRWWLVDISCKSEYSWIASTLWFALVTTNDLAFSEKFKFIQISLTVTVFSYGMDLLDSLDPLETYLSRNQKFCLMEYNFWVTCNVVMDF